MKGFLSKSSEKSVAGGLRRFAETPRDEFEPIVCHNLCPTEDGVELHETIYSLDSGSWGSGVPWLYLQDANGVLIEDSTGEPTEVIM